MYIHTVCTVRISREELIRIIKLPLSKCTCRKWSEISLADVTGSSPGTKPLKPGALRVLRALEGKGPTYCRIVRWNDIWRMRRSERPGWERTKGDPPDAPPIHSPRRIDWATCVVFLSKVSGWCRVSCPLQRNYGICICQVHTSMEWQCCQYIYYCMYSSLDLARSGPLSCRASEQL